MFHFHGYTAYICVFFSQGRKDSEGFKKNVRLEDHTPKGVVSFVVGLCITSFLCCIFQIFVSEHNISLIKKEKKNEHDSQL